MSSTPSQPRTARAGWSETDDRRRIRVRLTDDQGRTYIDAMAGLWCVNIGYGRLEIADAMYQQPSACPTTTRLVDGDGSASTARGATACDVASAHV